MFESVFKIYNLNNILYSKGKLSCRKIYELESCYDLEILSNCGILTYEFDKEEYDFYHEKNDLLYIAEKICKSETIQETLLDINFGMFSKSDLFFWLNNNIVIPTQLKHGLSLVQTPHNSSLSFEYEAFYICYIAHQIIDDRYFIEFVRAEMPGVDEIYIWGDIELKTSFKNGLNNISIQCALNALYNTFNNILPEEEKPILLQNNNHIYIPKPKSIEELFKYYRYIGIV